MVVNAGSAVHPTVLIVDDHALVLESIRGILLGDGYELITAASGAAALEKVAQHEPDLVLLDVMMPDMDGFEVCRRIRANPSSADVPVIMITALDDKASRVQGFEAGADDFVTKPPDRQVLRARVRTVTTLNRYRHLADERKRVAHLIDFSPDGIAVLDAEGIIQLNNPAFRKMLSPADGALWVGSPFEDCLDPTSRKEWDDARAAVLVDPETAVPLHAKLVTTTGAILDAEISVGAFPMDEGSGIQLIIRDVTLRRHLEKAVQRSERLDAIGRATSGVVHDFNNYLQAIRMDAEILSRNLEPESPHREDLANIIHVTEQGANLTKHLLTFARGDSHDHESLDLSEVVRGVEPVLAHMAGKKARLRFDVSSEPLPLTGNRTQLDQVIVNLVMNASDAIEPGGEIRIAAASLPADANPQQLNGGGPGVHLSVSDDGTGMDEDTRARIFEPFYSTKGEGGTGLGLAMVQDIVKGHGGTITVRSELGVGTTFDVYLPRSES